MGSRSEHDRMAVQVPEALAALLGVAPAEVEVRWDDPSGADLVIAAAGLSHETVAACGPEEGRMTVCTMSKLLRKALERLRTAVIGSSLLAAAFAFQASAGETPASRHWPGGLPGGAERRFEPDRDCGVVPASAGFHLINRVRPLPQAASTSLCSRDCGEPVEYRSWTGNLHQMRRFAGKYVQLLVPEEWLDLPDFGPEVRRSLVDSVDLAYQYFKDLTRREPAGQGLLPVAIVHPPYCGYGCGMIGAKGVEIDNDEYYFANGNRCIRGSAYLGMVQNAILHEMAHNFDVWHRYTPNQGEFHWWTDFVQIYLSVWTRWGTSDDSFFLDGLSPDEVLEAWLEATYWPYARLSSATWERCVKTEGCLEQGIRAKQARAGLGLRVAQVYGPRAIEGYFEYMDQHVRSNPPASLDRRGRRPVS